MSLIYGATTRTARLNAVVTDAGATAVLEIGTTGMATVLATVALASPIGTVSGDVLTLTMPRSDTSADAAGTAAAARIRKATGGADVITGLTVGTSGTDVVIDNTSIAAGQQVTVNSFTITHATT